MSDNMQKSASLDNTPDQTKDYESAANFDTDQITAAHTRSSITGLTYFEGLLITTFGILVAIYFCFAFKLPYSLPHPYDYFLGISIHSCVQSIYQHTVLKINNLRRACLESSGDDNLVMFTAGLVAGCFALIIDQVSRLGVQFQFDSLFGSVAFFIGTILLSIVLSVRLADTDDNGKRNLSFTTVQTSVLGENWWRMNGK